MSTSVGVIALRYILYNIANGIRMRMSMGSKPLDIILAENLIDVDARMRQMIYEKLNPEEQKWAEQHLGFVEASIGRMGPPVTEEEREKSPLLIAVEPYAELPGDSLGCKGPIPDLVGLKPFTPFDFYIKRKLFLQ